MKLVICSLLAMALVMFLCFPFRHGRGSVWKSEITPYVPVEGIVTGKEWIPAHEDTQYLTSFTGTGLPTVTMPYYVHYDETWTIFVGRRKCRVSKEEFKLVEIGVFWKEKLENDSNGR